MKGSEIDALLTKGARWCVERGYGSERDLVHTESGGRIEGAWRSGQALARALELQPPRRSACLAAG